MTPSTAPTLGILLIRKCIAMARENRSLPALTRETEAEESKVVAETPAASWESEAAREFCQSCDTHVRQGKAQAKCKTAAWEIAEVAAAMREGELLPPACERAHAPVWGGGRNTAHLWVWDKGQIQWSGSLGASVTSPLWGNCGMPRVSPGPGLQGDGQKKGFASSEDVQILHCRSLGSFSC